MIRLVVILATKWWSVSRRQSDWLDMKSTASSRAIIEQKKILWKLLRFKKNGIGQRGLQPFCMRQWKRLFFFLNIFAFLFHHYLRRSCQSTGRCSADLLPSRVGHLNANVSVGTCSNSFRRTVRNLCSSGLPSRRSKLICPLKLTQGEWKYHAKLEKFEFKIWILFRSTKLVIIDSAVELILITKILIKIKYAILF